MLRPCAIVKCPRNAQGPLLLKALNVRNGYFCAECQIEFEASTEAINLRPSSHSDYRDRVWKERCQLDVAAKIAQAERDAKVARA